MRPQRHGALQPDFAKGRKATTVDLDEDFLIHLSQAAPESRRSSSWGGGGGGGELLRDRQRPQSRRAAQGPRQALYRPCHRHPDVVLALVFKHMLYQLREERDMKHKNFGYQMLAWRTLMCLLVQILSGNCGNARRTSSQTSTRQLHVRGLRQQRHDGPPLLQHRYRAIISAY